MVWDMLVWGIVAGIIEIVLLLCLVPVIQNYATLLQSAFLQPIPSQECSGIGFFYADNHIFDVKNVYINKSSL